jgi:hypothetical protein
MVERNDAVRLPTRSHKDQRRRPLFSSPIRRDPLHMARPLCVECAGTFDHVTTNVMACGHVGSKDLSDPNGEGAWENKQAGARGIQALYATGLTPCVFARGQTEQISHLSSFTRSCAPPIPSSQPPKAARLSGALGNQKGVIA